MLIYPTLGELDDPPHPDTRYLSLLWALSRWLKHKYFDSITIRNVTDQRNLEYLMGSVFYIECLIDCFGKLGIPSE